MTVYFAILTYNRSKSLLQLLETIFKQSLPPGGRFQVVIWDNCSDETHVQAFRNSRFGEVDHVRYIIGKENAFMVGKRHLEDAVLDLGPDPKNDYLVHLDDDVQLSESWLSHVFRCMEQLRLDACGSVETWKGQLIYSGQTHLHTTAKTGDLYPLKVWKWQWQEVPANASVAGAEVAFAGHRALLVKMAVAVQVKHDPQMLIGGEDLDYSLALKAAGFRIGIAHQALIYHRLLKEEDAHNFRSPDKILHSWKHFHQKWGFVRNNVDRELQIVREAWLKTAAEWCGK